MTSTNYLTLFFCFIYLLLVIIVISKSKKENPNLKIKEYLLSESLFIPGFLLFLYMFIKFLYKVFWI